VGGFGLRSGSGRGRQGDEKVAPVVAGQPFPLDNAHTDILLAGRPADHQIAVQFHPEASPGPLDSRDLFDAFVAKL
jgi:hypothetical protein